MVRRAWQRMLSGRRLDLLDPTPVDIEVEDIAHGLAFVARWNGQTRGPHIFSVAQHSLLVEAISGHLQPELAAHGRLAVVLHDAAEYVLGDVISPFKAVIGQTYKEIEARLTRAIYLRFGLSAEPSPSLKRLMKRADRLAAFQEATRLAGFAREEALKFFGRPDPLPSSLDRYLTPWSIGTAQARYLERFQALMDDTRVACKRDAEPRPTHARLDLNDFELDEELRSKILLLRRAIKELKQVVGIAKGLRREFCPYTLGLGKAQDWKVFVWQFGGKSSRPLKGGADWRCLSLKELEDLRLLDGEWQHGALTGEHPRNSCIKEVDSDVALKPRITATA
jgi:5'-deoxynucleotidase YfbR-like HD superfamily hydrolase